MTYYRESNGSLIDSGVDYPDDRHPVNNPIPATNMPNQLPRGFVLACAVAFVLVFISLIVLAGVR